MSANRQDEGKKGEDLAAEFLKKKGFQIIDRNFRIRGGEIDIVAISPSTHDVRSGNKEGQSLVFIEVKTRSSSEYGSPFESITPWKLRALIKAAQFYKLKHPKLPELMRIDAVGVMLDYRNNSVKIEHLENVS